MRVLHVFDHSLPHHSGYSFRSEAIVRAQRDRGIDTLHLTGPKHDFNGSRIEVTLGLEFHRCPQVISGSGPLAQTRCVVALRRELRRLIEATRPDLLHCHSPCLNGLAALGLGIPVVYEVRACWEDAAVSSGTTREGSMRYRASRALETYVARRADALVVICEGLNAEFTARGVPPSHVTVVGNAIDPASIPTPSAEAVRSFRRVHGLGDRKVIGFFGSFYKYEGLELLVSSMPQVLRAVPDAVALLAGGGEAEASIETAVRRLGLERSVMRLGRIPHESIGACYGAATVMAFPRLQQKLTDMVTPLKPIEAGFLGVPVVASNVGGHQEIVSHNDTGLLFPAGSPDELAKALIRVLNDQELRTRLARRAREYVLRERLWSHMAERYERIYSCLLTGVERPGDANGSD